MGILIGSCTGCMIVGDVLDRGVNLFDLWCVMMRIC